MVDKQRILIVDDDENIAELISLYLTKECYETKIVGDGESALKEVPVFKPNLVLLDLMLPEIFRKVLRHSPLIIPSVYGGDLQDILQQLYSLFHALLLFLKYPFLHHLHIWNGGGRPLS